MLLLIVAAVAVAVGSFQQSQLSCSFSNGLLLSLCIIVVGVVYPSERYRCFLLFSETPCCYCPPCCLLSLLHVITLVQMSCSFQQGQGCLALFSKVRGVLFL